MRLGGVPDPVEACGSARGLQAGCKRGQRSGVLITGLLGVGLGHGVQASWIGVERREERGVPLEGWKPMMQPLRHPGGRGGGRILQVMGWTASW